jgi:hypothetical protein
LPDVVTGSVITGGFQYVTTMRTERSDALAAKRLIAAELGTYYAALDDASGGKTLPSVIIAQVADRSAWKANNGRLARILSEDAWLRVEGIYWRLDSIAEEAKEQGRIRPDRAADLRDEIDRAMKDLEPGLRDGIGRRIR